MRISNRAGFASLAAMLIASVPGWAVDLGKQVAFDIPRQKLSTALLQFAQQAHVQLVLREDLGEASTSQVSGMLSIGDALNSLLGGSGLDYKVVSETAITVGRFDQARSEASAASFQLAQTDTSSAEESPAGTRNTTTPQANGGAAASEVELEEIVVTAQKRVERLIDVPQAVTVLSADYLAKLGATQFRDFANTVPGLSFFTLGAGNTQISLRGVTVGTDIGATVATYVDEVPYGASSKYGTPQLLALDVGLFDFDRIEVLRGPQGTLYGASTMGGLLKYVTRQPDSNHFGVNAQTGVSSTKDGGISYNGALAINAPVSADKAALRLSTFYSHDGGYIDNVARNENDVNQSDIYGGRADFLLTPSDKLSVRLTAFAQNIDRDGEGTEDHVLTTAAQDFEGGTLDGPLEQRRAIAEPFDNRFRLASGTVTYDFAGAQLVSVSSYQEARSEYVTDISIRFVPFCGTLICSAVSQLASASTDKFTQEMRLASKGERTLEWVVGGFYTHEDTEDHTDFPSLDLAGQPRPSDLFVLFVPSRYEEYAAFGDLTWHLTDRFDVTGGLRQSRNNQEFEQFGSGSLGGAPSPFRKESDDVTTYLANARYHFGDRATAYLRYATGYRPGGPNNIVVDPVTGIPLGPPTYEADRLRSYEIGFKAETAGRRFGFDVAAYDIDWDNIAIAVGRGAFSGTGNASGGATVRGAELALTMRPLQALTVAGAFAYQDAFMNEADPPVLPTFPFGRDLRNRKGERLPSVPRFTASLNADYALPIGGWQPILGVTARHVGDRTASFDRSTVRPQYRVPEYTSVDLRAGLTFGSVNAQLYVRNVFDDDGALSATFTNLRTARSAVLQPRTFGLMLSTKF